MSYFSSTVKKDRPFTLNIVPVRYTGKGFSGPQHQVPVLGKKSVYTMHNIALALFIKINQNIATHNKIKSTKRIESVQQVESFK